MSLHFFFQKHRYITLGIIALIGCGLVANYYYSFFGGQVYTYAVHRDKVDVRAIFQDNWDWLIHEDPQRVYNVDTLLDHGVDVGGHECVMKVVRDKNKTVGFTAYYQESPSVWRFLFLAVDQEYRKKGYARKLLKKAVQDMKSRGAIKVILLTRQDNQRALGLYKSEGFKETHTSGIGVYLAKYLK